MSNPPRVRFAQTTLSRYVVRRSNVAIANAFSNAEVVDLAMPSDDEDVVDMAGSSDGEHQHDNHVDLTLSSDDEEMVVDEALYATQPPDSGELYWSDAAPHGQNVASQNNNNEERSNSNNEIVHVDVVVPIASDNWSDERRQLLYRIRMAYPSDSDDEVKDDGADRVALLDNYVARYGRDGVEAYLVPSTTQAPGPIERPSQERTVVQGDLHRSEQLPLIMETSILDRWTLVPFCDDLSSSNEEPSVAVLPADNDGISNPRRAVEQPSDENMGNDGPQPSESQANQNRTDLSEHAIEDVDDILQAAATTMVVQAQPSHTAATQGLKPAEGDSDVDMESGQSIHDEFSSEEESDTDTNAIIEVESEGDQDSDVDMDANSSIEGDSPRSDGSGAVDADDGDQEDLSSGGAPSTAGPKFLKKPKPIDGQLQHETIDYRLPTGEYPLTFHQHEFQACQQDGYMYLVEDFDIDGVTIEGPVEMINDLAGLHMDVWGGPIPLSDMVGKKKNKTKISSCGTGAYFISKHFRLPFAEALNQHFGVPLLLRRQERNLLAEARTLSRWDFLAALKTINCKRILYQAYGEKSSVNEYGAFLTSLSIKYPTATITVDFSRHVAFKTPQDKGPYQTVVDSIRTNDPVFGTMDKLLFRDFSMAQLLQHYPLLRELEDCYGSVVFTKKKESFCPWLEKVKVYNKSVHILKITRAIKWSWIPRTKKILKPFRRHFRNAIDTYRENKTSEKIKWSRVEMTMSWVDVNTAERRFDRVFQRLRHLLIVRHIDMDLSINCMEKMFQGLTNNKRLFTGSDSGELTETSRREYAWMVDTIGTGNNKVQDLVRISFRQLGSELFSRYILDRQVDIVANDSSEEESDSSASDSDQEATSVLSDEALRIYRSVRMKPTAQGKFRAHYKSGGQCMVRATRIQLAQDLEAKRIDWSALLFLNPADL